MRQLSILDCTLRDGGYVNNWVFGSATIKGMLNKLVLSGIEYVECGYLSAMVEANDNSTQFASLEQVRMTLPEPFGTQRFAIMIDYGKMPIEMVANAEPGDPVIRVCFHKEDEDAALSYCAALMAKGHDVFIQPMASLSYGDAGFIDLIKRVNELEPKAFYIVDSFGTMELPDFMRLLHVTDKNLDHKILLGYHSHNNLQQAYGNAKYMVEQMLNHDLIVDSSVYGMGRGAGNLNSELFASFLNERFDKSYNVDVLLDIMDEHLKPIFAEHYWGYSLPFYLSARYDCHPNFAEYFANKNTLTNKSMRQLLSSLPDDVRSHYSPSTAEHYYQEFMRCHVDDSEAVSEIRSRIEDKSVLLLAPGKSLSTHRAAIEAYIEENQPVVIAVNVVPASYRCDFVYCSNEKRLRRLSLPEGCELIISSNIAYDGRAICIDYASYLAGEDFISDNPMLMLLRLLIAMGQKEVTVAGFDGYSPMSVENYYDPSLALGTNVDMKIGKNKAITEEMKAITQFINVDYLTPSIYNQ